MSLCPLLLHVEHAMCMSGIRESKIEHHVLEIDELEIPRDEGESAPAYRTLWTFWRRSTAPPKETYTITPSVSEETKDNPNTSEVIPDVLDTPSIQRSQSFKNHNSTKRHLPFRTFSNRLTKKSPPNQESTETMFARARKKFIDKKDIRIVLKDTNGTNVDLSVERGPALIHNGNAGNANTNVETENKLNNNGTENGLELKSDQNGVFDVADDSYRLPPNDPMGTLRKYGGRHRKKSGDKTLAKHQKILNCIAEILYQSFDALPVIDALFETDIIDPVKFGHLKTNMNKRFVSEVVVKNLYDSDHSNFLKFCEIVRDCKENCQVSHLLDCLVHIYKLIDHIRDKELQDNQTLADERSIAVEVGFYDLERGVMKPPLELRGSKNGINQPYQRKNSKSSLVRPASRGSFSSVEDGIGNSQINHGIPMVNICISGHSLHNKGAEILSEIIEQYDCILEMRLGKAQIEDSDIGVLANALKKNEGMTVMDLRLNPFGNDGAKYLASAVKENYSLLQLNVSSTNMTTLGCKVLSEAMKSNTSIRELDYSFLDVGDKGCIAVADMLRNNTKLVKLRIRSDNISSYGCAVLFEGLKRNKDLIHLDLSGNTIGDEGAEILGNLLSHANVLRELNLENCGITAAGCNLLSDALLFNKSIETLDLSANDISDTGVGKICDALDRNNSTKLKCLGLNMCSITNDGFSKVLDLLEHSTSITLLKLCYNKLGREYTNPSASSENLRYRVRIVTSSRPGLKLLLWGNSFEENEK